MKRVHVNNQSRIVRAAGFDPNEGYCGPTAWSMALADDVRDEDAVIALLPAVVARMEAAGILRNGTTFRGGLQPARVLGIYGTELRKEKNDPEKVRFSEGGGWHRERHERLLYRQSYPTLAQWARRNPDVGAAVVRGTNHLGYVEKRQHGRTQARGPRHHPVEPVTEEGRC